MPRKLTTDEFIIAATARNKNKYFHPYPYTYDKTVYEHSTKKVIISCIEHGDFAMEPRQHLHGRGCPKCMKIKLRLKRKSLKDLDLMC